MYKLVLAQMRTFGNLLYRTRRYLSLLIGEQTVIFPR
jgi:hypothetical protein